MKIRITESRGVTILTPMGKLTIGGGDINLRDAIVEALDAGSRKLLLVLSNTRTIDSSGLAELVTGFTMAVNRGGKLKLACPAPKVDVILKVTHLRESFEVFDSEEEAIASFG